MARRIREADWSSHPFGAAETWPQSLRSALSICLNSAFPTAIYWGHELRLLYNDAWAPIPGPRHPASLGAPAREVWSDIWPIIEPQFTEVIRTGTGLFLEDQLLPMRRHGLLEETYWSYSFSPLRGEKGQIVGVWNSGSETTGNVIQRRNAECIVRLNEALRGCSSAEAGQRVALERLGTHLGADHVELLEVDAEGRLRSASEVYPPTSQASSSDGPTALGPGTLAALKAGRDVHVRLDDRALEPEMQQALRSRNLAAGILVPWARDGVFAAVLCVHWSALRASGLLELALVEKVLETTMAWAELERAREREAVMMEEIDHRARNILAILRSVSRLISAETLAEYKDKLDDRITALSRIHGLLSQRRWDGLSLREVFAAELDSFGAAERVGLVEASPAVALQATDAQLLAMMFHELLSNALQHGALADPAGTLEVSWHRKAPEGGLLLSWTERSQSIQAPRREQLPRGFGTLLLCRVVEDHFQGHIDRNIAAGELRYDITFSGSTWGSDAAVPTAQTAQTAPQAVGRSVMIVEDEPIIALDLAGIVAEAGYAVFGQYGTVLGALEAIERGLPDLALLDENLAGERSTPVLERLMAEGVPVVIISGYDGEGMTGVPRLAKPISEGELLATLKNL